mmetsp:Transcript_17935/g.51091  ORF Transcript_17935/g.51091 Transcript_17935/m.51091 type:complete len:234 (-) Transcript_17935:157-858(-)
MRSSSSSRMERVFLSATGSAKNSSMFLIFQPLPSPRSTVSFQSLSGGGATVAVRSGASVREHNALSAADARTSVSRGQGSLLTSASFSMAGATARSGSKAGVRATRAASASSWPVAPRRSHARSAVNAAASASRGNSSTGDRDQRSAVTVGTRAIAARRTRGSDRSSLTTFASVFELYWPRPVRSYTALESPPERTDDAARTTVQASSSSNKAARRPAPPVAARVMSMDSTFS